MKTHITAILTALGFAVVCVTPAFADDMEALTGKWSVQKTNEDGQRYTQQIEIKKDKFIFKISDKDGDTMIYAEGKAKLDKAGPFNTISFTDIQDHGEQFKPSLDVMRKVAAPKKEAEAPK